MIANQEHTPSIKSQFPKKTARLGRFTIKYCKFESKKETLSTKEKFDYYTMVLIGHQPVPSYGPGEIQIDPVDLLISTTLAKNKSEAKQLLKKGRIKIGEPYKRMKTLSTKKIFIKEPFNALLTLNRSLVDWVFVTFEP